MKHYGNTSEVKVKESISSVVTEADLASENAIIRVLLDTPEPCNIISEEAGYIDSGSPFTWVVDPLDGTSNFAAGLPWFGVIIALFRDSVPVQAGMYMPVEDQLYFAGDGEGAWRNRGKIKCTDAKDLDEILVSYSFDFSSDPGKTEREMELLNRLSKKIRNTRATNSLIDFCYTADGRLGAAINQSTRIWDIAAPTLIIKEAGGIASDISGSAIQFDLSPESINSNYTIVASGSKVHSPLMKIINQT